MWQSSFAQTHSDELLVFCMQNHMNRPISGITKGHGNAPVSEWCNGNAIRLEFLDEISIELCAALQSFSKSLRSTLHVCA